jgi:hypothetical protein
VREEGGRERNGSNNDALTTGQRSAVRFFSSTLGYYLGKGIALPFNLLVDLFCFIFRQPRKGVLGSSCVFCDIIGLRSRTLEYEDDDVVCFKPRSGNAFKHFLVVPKRHIKDVSALTPADKQLLVHMHRVGRFVLLKHCDHRDNHRGRRNSDGNEGSGLQVSLQDALKYHTALDSRFSFPDSKRECDDLEKQNLFTSSNDTLVDPDDRVTRYCFHLSPFNSINHLHLHCFHRPFLNSFENVSYTTNHTSWSCSVERVISSL